MALPYRLQGTSLEETMKWLGECSIIVQHDHTVIERDNNNPNIAHIRVEKTEPKKTETQKPETPSYEELAKAAQVLLKRNTALETEVGRLHMMLNAYEQQFADMREAMNRMKLDDGKTV